MLHSHSKATRNALSTKSAILLLLELLRLICFLCFPIKGKDFSIEFKPTPAEYNEHLHLFLHFKKYCRLFADRCKNSLLNQKSKFIMKWGMRNNKKHEMKWHLSMHDCVICLEIFLIWIFQIFHLAMLRAKTEFYQSPMERLAYKNRTKRYWTRS